jgi:hypothetical protein
MKTNWNGKKKVLIFVENLTKNIEERDFFDHPVRPIKNEIGFRQKRDQKFATKFESRTANEPVSLLQILSLSLSLFFFSLSVNFWFSKFDPFFFSSSDSEGSQKDWINFGEFTFTGIGGREMFVYIESQMINKREGGVHSDSTDLLRSKKVWDSKWVS